MEGGEAPRVGDAAVFDEAARALEGSAWRSRHELLPRLGDGVVEPRRGGGEASDASLLSVGVVSGDEQRPALRVGGAEVGHGARGGRSRAS